MVYAPCPACVMQHVGAVASPECPVCAGQARISLHPASCLAEGRASMLVHDRTKRGGGGVPEATAMEFGARVLCRAVWLGLGRAARSTVGEPAAVRERVLRERMAGFRDTLVVDPTAPVVTAGGVEDDPVVAQELDQPFTGPVLNRVPLGQPPKVSAAGHPSALARAVDPVNLDTVAPFTRAAVHHRLWWSADRVDQAVTLASASPAHPHGLIGKAA